MKKNSYLKIALEVLLNSDRNEMFENIRDAALDGDKKNLMTF